MTKERKSWHDFHDFHQSRVERVYNENGSVRVDCRRIDRPSAFEYGVYVSQSAPGWTKVPQVGWIALVHTNEENHKVAVDFLSGPEVIDSEAVPKRFRDEALPTQQQYKQVEMPEGAVAMQTDRGTGIVSRPPGDDLPYDDYSIADTTWGTRSVSISNNTYTRSEEDLELVVNPTHDTTDSDGGLAEGHTLEIHSNNDLRLRVGGKVDIQEDVAKPTTEDALTKGEHTGGTQLKLLTESEWQDLLDIIQRVGEAGRADWDVMNEVALLADVDSAIDTEVRDVLDKKVQDVRNISSPADGQQAFHDGSGTNTAGPAAYHNATWIALRDNTEIT